MNQAIIVTGTPGTGKTMLAKALAKKLGLVLVDVKKVIKAEGLDAQYDPVRKTYEVSVPKLNRALSALIQKSKKGLLIDSHLSHYLPKTRVAYCVVTKCDLKILKKRLESRGYDKLKVRENLDAEIFDICLVEARERGHKVVVIDTTKRISKKGLEQLKSTLQPSLLIGNI